jgi:hypothetical protein
MLPLFVGRPPYLRIAMDGTQNRPQFLFLSSPVERHNLWLFPL